MIICIAGKMGTGKSALTDELSKKLNSTVVSISEYLRHIAKKHEVSNPSREYLQQIGDVEKAKGWSEFCDSIVSFSGWDKTGVLIIEGIRQPEFVIELQGKYGIDNVLLVLLTIDDSVQLSRLQSRDGRGFSREAKHHPTENAEERLMVLSELAYNTELKSVVELSESIISHLGKAFPSCILK